MGKGNEQVVVGSGEPCCHSWAVVLSPCLLSSSCIGIMHHCHVLLLPGCPLSLSCLCVSACGRWLIFACGHWLVVVCPGCVAMPCSWCWVILCGAGLLFVGARLLFVRVVVHGCCLLEVICRQVGQDEGGKGGAHQCHSINND